MSTLFDEFPYFNNLHTRTQALGLATFDASIYYLSTAGPGTSCKSVWSSLVSNRGQIDCPPWGYDLAGAANLQTVYQGLPNSNFQHMVSLHKSANFLIAADVPIVREWAPELWQIGLAEGGIMPLDSFGDCLGAWLVQETFDWLAVVQTLLGQGRIRFPTLP